ncbi:MAG: ABC transporter ATP-binding protein [Candidatus Pacearchaeota archaeon]|jgi:ABC-2 type transport system ATP-binding protein
MAILEVINVSKAFKKKRVLENVSISVEKGDILGLIGHSGSGKSVLLKMILGFFKPDSGEIIINANNKHSIGFSMQENSIYENLTVKQNLTYFARLYGLKRRESKQRVDFLINLLELGEFKKILVTKLSGGTKKRVDLACSLLNDPEILLLDEPLVGLDPYLVSLILRIILYLKNQGKTIVITSHMLPEISRICTKFAAIKDKQIFFMEKEKIYDLYNKNGI